MSGGQGQTGWSRAARTRPRVGGAATVGAALLGIGLLGTAVGVAGCGGTDFGDGAGAHLPAGRATTSLPPAVTPPFSAIQAKVVRSVARTQASKRARTSISVTFSGFGADTLASGAFDVAGSGVVDLVGGNADLTLSIPLFDRLGGGGSIEQRIVSRVVYTKLPAALLRKARVPASVRWLSLDLRAPALERLTLAQSQVDPAGELALLGSVADGVRTEGTESVPTTHYAVRIDPTDGSAGDPRNAALSTKLAQLGSALASRPVVVEVWLDADGRARRVVTTFPLAAPVDPAATGPDAMMRVQSDYYAFGVPVHVVAPAPADVRPYRALAPTTTPG
jgi:hypothetical protein